MLDLVEDRLKTEIELSSWSMMCSHINLAGSFVDGAEQKMLYGTEIINNMFVFIPSLPAESAICKQLVHMHLYPLLLNTIQGKHFRQVYKKKTKWRLSKIYLNILINLQTTKWIN